VAEQILAGPGEFWYALVVSVVAVVASFIFSINAVGEVIWGMQRGGKMLGRGGEQTEEATGNYIFARFVQAFALALQAFSGATLPWAIVFVTRYVRDGAVSGNLTLMIIMLCLTILVGILSGFGHLLGLALVLPEPYYHSGEGGMESGGRYPK